MTKFLWKATKVIGSLKWRSHEAQVKFNVVCDRTGRLFFSSLNVPFGTETLWLNSAFHSGGRYIEFLALDGIDHIGQKIHTPYFYLTGLKHGKTRRSSRIILKGTTTWLEVTPMPKDHSNDSRIVSRYHVVGMKGFRAQKTTCDLGQILMGARSKVDNYDKLTGLLEFVTDKHSISISDWIKACDKKADMILEIMSLAQDRRLDWGVREVFNKGKLSSLFFRGPHNAPRPEYPIFSHLHLQPALNLAAQVYTDYLRDKLGMGFAIEYFLMRPRFLELRFIAAMTGLEHLLQRFCSIHKKGGIVDNKLFRNTVLPALKNILNETGLNPDEVLTLFKKLPDINRAALRENLFSFLEHYRVPLKGISTEQISNLVRVRNTLAHGRLYRKTPFSERLSDDITILQELMRRILLTLLGYSGNCWSYLNGPEWVNFPQDL